jgi:glycosyltransferase involved in cell wall biosynthesis
MRNILFVHHSNDLYGADIVLLETVKRLDRTQFHPVVVLPEDTRHIGRLTPHLEALGIEHRFLPLGVMRRRYLKPGTVARFAIEFASAVGKLRRLMREKKIDAVHTNTLAVCAGAIAAKLEKVPHIWHVHEILVDPVFLRRLLHAVVFRFSTVTVCISKAVRDHYLADQPAGADNTITIPNGIDLEKFSPVSDGADVRAEYGIPADAPLVGMVGKVTRWKGQFVFAQAAKKILEAAPDSYFLAVGGVFDDERYYMDNFRNEVIRLGIQDRFMIRDYRPDVVNVLRAFDVFVLPSTLPEPFGLVVVEAMACKKAIVATAHGGPAEMIVDGESGLLVKPGGPDALAEGVVQLLRNRDLLHSMGKAAKARAWDKYHVDRYIHAFEQLYATITSKSKASVSTSSELRQNHSCYIPE